LLSGLLRHLPAQPAQPRTIFAFELKLLSELGLDPDLKSLGLKPETKNLILALRETDWSELVNLKANKSQATELSRFLYGFLVFHLGKLPKGRGTALPQVAIADRSQ